jgi:hypothetical protein
MTVAIPYPDGVVTTLLRTALPGVTVETQQAPDLSDRVPYLAVRISNGNSDLSLGLINVTITVDAWAKPSKRTAWVLSMSAVSALITAWREQTLTDDGYLKYIDVSGDLPQEFRLAGQAADLFHFQWTTDLGVRSPES